MVTDATPEDTYLHSMNVCSEYLLLDKTKALSANKSTNNLRKNHQLIRYYYSRQARPPEDQKQDRNWPLDKGQCTRKTKSKTITMVRVHCSAYEDKG